MAPDEHNDLRVELRKIIGNDVLILKAKDSQQRFDPITLGAGYGAALLLAFVSAAGKKTGEALWKKISALLSKTNDKTTIDTALQIEQIKTADEALKVIGEGLSGQYLGNFVDAGRSAVEQQLLLDKFPPEKAKRIASAIAKIVSEKVGE